MVSANSTPGGSRFCANCGTPLDPNAQFCANCGQPRGEPAPAAGFAGPAAGQANDSWMPPVAPLSTTPYYAPPVTQARSGGSGRCLIIAGVAVLGLLLLLCCGGLGIYWLTQMATPTPTPSPAPLRPTNTVAPTVAAPSATPTALARTATPTVAATATATLKPAATATSTATPKPTSTATPSVLSLDDFSSRQASADKGWNLDPGTNVDCVWSQGKLTVLVKKAHLIGLNWPAGDYLDFAAEVEAQPTGADFAEYGIIFRLSGVAETRTYYAFGIRSDGKYYLYQFVSGAWIDKDAVPITVASQIKQGPTKNTVGVIVQGNKISLLINRVLVKTVTDDSIKTAGRVGVFVGTQDNTSTSVAFTKYTVLTVEKAKADWGVP
jgi:hypothetical protein